MVDHTLVGGSWKGIQQEVRHGVLRFAITVTYRASRRGSNTRRIRSIDDEQRRSVSDIERIPIVLLQEVQ